MAYFPKETQVKTALQEKTNQINLSCDHLTTMDFAEPNVAYYRHTTPREKFKADISVFARPAPIQVPILAKATHKLSAYFVPFRVISPQWNDFITRTPHIPANGNTPININEMPFFYAGELAELIRTDTDVATQVQQGQAYDYHISSQYFKLTKFGAFIIKVMNQLGYKVFVNGKAQDHIDAMALLAYAKIYVDFYANSAYMNGTQLFIRVNQLFAYDNSTVLTINGNDIKAIFQLAYVVCYDQDYFTSAWDNPTSPNYFGAIGSISMSDINNVGVTISNGVQGQNGEARINDTASTTTFSEPLTQYALDALKAMTEYTSRYALAGVRSVDRYLARFGVLLAAEKMKRCVYYGTQETPMEMGSVYSTASTNNASLGDYAGTGIINSDGKEHKTFEIDTEEYGIIMMISTIIPKIGYFQGIDRNNLHHEVETYISPEFDQLGTQAVSKAEIYVSKENNTISDSNLIQGIFGYLPRYIEYKIPRDRLTGDFERNSMALSENWHLFRIFDDSYWNNDYLTIVHNPDFTRFTDREQYLRIFNSTNEEDGDHFNVIYQIKANANIHFKDIYDTFDFESRGKEILMKTNGPKKN